MTEFKVDRFDPKTGGVLVTGGSREFWFPNVAGANSVRMNPGGNEEWASAANEALNWMRFNYA